MFIYIHSSYQEGYELSKAVWLRGFKVKDSSGFNDKKQFSITRIEYYFNKTEGLIEICSFSSLYSILILLSLLLECIEFCIKNLTV